MNIFIFAAYNKIARKNINATIENSVDQTLLQEILLPNQFSELLAAANNTEIYCWGARPGDRNEPNWNLMQVGDPVLSYWNHQYHHIAYVIYKIRNQALAERLWGRAPQGDTWEFIYFLSKPIEVSNLPNSSTPSYLPDSARGFTKVAEDKTQNILTDFGTFENFIRPYINTPPAPPVLPNAGNMRSVKEIIQHVCNYIQGEGFHYTYEDIANFYLSLCAKPFVILAGISGTGKTQLPRMFAKALGFSPGQVVQLPVRPDWTDGSELLGYTALDGNFVPKTLLLTIQEASKRENKDKPYFFILDEMNLARVEHYLSDFLSIIETRHRETTNGPITTEPILKKETLQGTKNKEEFPEMGWPDNLYLIGTVNMDETTYAFSHRVLDRANTIEMNNIDFEWKKPVAIKPLPGNINPFIDTPYLLYSDLNDQQQKSIATEMKLLNDINKILTEHGLEFAYRTRNQIAFYLYFNNKYQLIENKKINEQEVSTAFDIQIVQKILPRIHGSSERIQTALIELLNKLEGTTFSTKNFEFTKLSDTKKQARYPRATKKIIFMLRRFDEDRITSFWP